MKNMLVKDLKDILNKLPDDMAIVIPVIDEDLYCFIDEENKVNWRNSGILVFANTIDALNAARKKYLETKDKEYWWQMIQLLPSSYNQKRTVMLNYEVLSNIYKCRKDHKLDEWRDFCDWIEKLPYSELITGGVKE